MSVQIYSYGSLLRLVTDGTVLLISKSQVKTLEVIRNDTIKISLGDGTLNELLIKLIDVTVPSGLIDISDLRDRLSHMLDFSNGYEEQALVKLQSEIDSLAEIKQILTLWNSTQQVELNYQQLQVNALISIGNRLLEEKENNQQLLSSIQDQTLSVKEQSITILGMTDKISGIKDVEDNLLTRQDTIISLITSQAIQFASMVDKLTNIGTIDQNIYNKQDSQSNIVSDIKVNTGLIKTNLADILNELKSQTNKLSTIDTTLNDIRSQNSSFINKQDSVIQLLTEIKQVLSNSGGH